MKYTINLIQDLLVEEKREKRRKLRQLTYFTTAMAILVTALFYTTLQVLSMRQMIEFEKEKLAKIEEEYRKYQATSMIVNRSDIELLDKLQRDRVFWTEKLAATALHLPDEYWIEKIGFSNTYKVSGYGLIEPEQEQLITVDDYLNLLRADTTFNYDFPIVFLNAVTRTDEGKTMRVSFELSSNRQRRN